MLTSIEQRIIEWMQGNPAQKMTNRDVAEGAGLNLETVSLRMRRLTRAGFLVQKGTRPVPRQAEAKCYMLAVGDSVEGAAWAPGSSQAATIRAEAVADLTTEINGALDTWCRWVKAGRPKLIWQTDPHYALAMALDRQISRMDPHHRSAVEKIWGLRFDFSYARHELLDSYDEAITALRMFYRVDDALAA